MRRCSWLIQSYRHTKTQTPMMVVTRNNARRGRGTVLNMTDIRWMHSMVEIKVSALRTTPPAWVFAAGDARRERQVAQSLKIFVCFSLEGTVLTFCFLSSLKRSMHQLAMQGSHRAGSANLRSLLRRGPI